MFVGKDRVIVQWLSFHPHTFDKIFMHLIKDSLFIKFVRDLKEVKLFWKFSLIQQCC